MEAVNRVFLSHDLITITILIGFVLVFLMKLYKPKDLLGYTIAFFTQGFIEDRAIKKTSIFSIFYGLLFVFSTIIMALTIFILGAPEYFEKNMINLVTVFSGTFVYNVVKYSFGYFLGVVFDLKEQLNYLFYAKNGYLYTSCILLFPLLILDQYFIKNKLVLLSFIAALLIFRVFLILKNNKSLIFNHMFYFILYFCALELTPLLILYKTIN